MLYVWKCVRKEVLQKRFGARREINYLLKNSNLDTSLKTTQFCLCLIHTTGI